MNINLTLIGQMITFAIFIYFTMRFVWPPMKKAMEERTLKIADGLSAADNAEKELIIAERKSAEIIQNAKYQAATIVDHATEKAYKINEDAKEVARLDVESIRRAATEQLELEVQEVKNNLRQEVVKVALLGAEKIIGKNLNASIDDSLLEDLSAQI